MTKAERRKRFMEYREAVMSKGTKAQDLQRLLTETGTLIFDYAGYLKPGRFNDVISGVEDFSFRECCAYLTFILRFELMEGNWYKKCEDDGSIYKLVNRTLEVM